MTHQMLSGTRLLFWGTPKKIPLLEKHTLTDWRSIDTVFDQKGYATRGGVHVAKHTVFEEMNSVERAIATGG